MACGIRRAVKVRPFPFDFDVGFIDAVGVIGRPQVKANSFLMFRSIRLNQPINHRVFATQLSEEIQGSAAQFGATRSNAKKSATHKQIGGAEAS